MRQSSKRQSRPTVHASSRTFLDLLTKNLRGYCLGIASLLTTESRNDILGGDKPVYIWIGRSRKVRPAISFSVDAMCLVRRRLQDDNIKATYLLRSCLLLVGTTGLAYRLDGLPLRMSDMDHLRPIKLIVEDELRDQRIQIARFQNNE